MRSPSIPIILATTLLLLLLPSGPAVSQGPLGISSMFRESPLPDVILLGEKGVRAELKITQEQGKKLQAIYDARMKLILSYMPGRTHPVLHQRQLTAIEKQFADVLTAAQHKRLRQLTFQSQGAMGVINAQLGVTFEQQKEIMFTIMLDRAPGAAKIRESSLPPAELDKRLAAYEKETQNQALKVLTPAQLTRWQELVGTPYTGTLPYSYGNARLPGRFDSD